MHAAKEEPVRRHCEALEEGCVPSTVASGRQCPRGGNSVHMSKRGNEVFVDGQVGCAACGVSARVERTVRHIHPRTGRRVYSLHVIDGCSLAFGLYIVMALIDGIVLGEAFTAFPSEALRTIIGLSLVVFSIIVPLVLSLAIVQKVNKTFSQALEVPVYCCTKCGKQW